MTLDIAGLRALITAATPGPWEPYGGLAGPPGVESLDNGHTVAEMFGCDEHPPHARADAAFVAATRDALPAALDEIERLQAEVAAHDGEYGDLRAKLSATEAEVDRLRDRDRAKATIHPVLHSLNVRIVGIDKGDCHCNLIAEVILDALLAEGADRG